MSDPLLFMPLICRLAVLLLSSDVVSGLVGGLTDGAIVSCVETQAERDVWVLLWKCNHLIPSFPDYYLHGLWVTSTQLHLAALIRTSSAFQVADRHSPVPPWYQYSVLKHTAGGPVSPWYGVLKLMRWDHAALLGSSHFDCGNGLIEGHGAGKTVGTDYGIKNITPCTLEYRCHHGISNPH
jgi:hypothetical protein